MAKVSHTREVLIALMLVLALLVIALVVGRISFLPPKHGLEGKEAPEIVFIDSQKKPSKLSQKKGIVILLYFWTIICDECMRELPQLEQLEKHFKDDGFVLLAFNIADHEDKLTREVRGGSYPKNLIFHFSKENLYAYGIKGLPMAVFIDKKGMVREVMVGKTNWLSSEIIMKIKNLLR